MEANSFDQDRDGKLRIAVTGSSGLVGSSLTRWLSAQGHDVLRIVRTPPRKDADAVFWSYQEGLIDTARLEGLDAVVHLAGENVMVPRWSEEKKMQIYGSRVHSTEFLSKTLASLQNPPKVLLSASGIAYYGNQGDKPLDESAPPGERGFMSAICRDWEAAVEPAAEAGIRTVSMRLGTVITPLGGLLSWMLPTFRLFIGGSFGDGARQISWIALEDVLRAIRHLLITDALSGPVNLAAPNAVNMREFTESLGRVLSRPTAFDLPSGLFRLLLGEVADETILLSVRAHPKRLIESGFEFKYPDIDGALRWQLQKQMQEPVAEAF